MVSCLFGLQDSWQIQAEHSDGTHLQHAAPTNAITELTFVIRWTENIQHRGHLNEAAGGTTAEGRLEYRNLQEYQDFVGQEAVARSHLMSPQVILWHLL